MGKRKISRQFIIVCIVIAVLAAATGIALYFLSPIFADIEIAPDCKGQTPCNSAYCAQAGIDGTNPWAYKSGWVPREVTSDISKRYQGYVTKVFDLYVTMMTGYVREVASAKNESNPSDTTVFLPNSTMKFAYEIRNPTSSQYSLITTVSFKEASSGRSLGQLSFGTVSIAPKSTWSSTKTLNLPPDLNTSGIRVTVTHSRVAVPARGESYCVATVKNIMVLSTKPSTTATATATATRTATATATATTTGTASATSTATATSTSSATGETLTIKNGWTAIAVPWGGNYYLSKPFTDLGMSVFAFNRAGDKKWHYSPDTSLKNLRWNVGYYVYNPGAERTVKLTLGTSITGTYREAPDVRAGWNLLAISNSGKAYKLSEIPVNVVDVAGTARCPGTTNCVVKKTLKELLAGDANTRRGYRTLYLIKDPYAMTAETAFQKITVTDDNLDTVTIPANVALSNQYGYADYWFYLFP